MFDGDDDKYMPLMTIASDDTNGDNDSEQELQLFVCLFVCFFQPSLVVISYINVLNCRYLSSICAPLLGRTYCSECHPTSGRFFLFFFPI